MNLNLTHHIGNTPMIRLQAVDAPVPIYVKCEHLNPTGSVKDRLALALITAAEEEGKLRAGDTIVEATSGNTGLGLAMIAAVRGYRLVCVMPEKMSVDKRRALDSMGAKVVITADAPLDSEDNFRRKAEYLAAKNGWFLADQFRASANVKAHFSQTGPEVYQQLNESLGAFVCGAGTGGTITGVGRYLKSKDPNIRIVLADPVGSALAGWIESGQYGPDSFYAVEGIGNSCVTEILDTTVIDQAISISDERSFETTRTLHREHGLLVGGSSGTTVAAALELARSETIDKPIVALLADSWDRYFTQPWMSEFRQAVIV